MPRIAAEARCQLFDGEPVLLAPFTPGDVDGAGNCRYRLELNRRGRARCSTKFGRVPDHPHLSHPYELGLMRKL